MKTRYLILICILALVAVVGIAVGAVTYNQQGETSIEVTSELNGTDGGNISVTLKEGGNPVSNEPINVTLVNADGTRNTINSTTNSKGVANVTLDNITNDTVLIECSYVKNDTQCNVTVPIATPLITGVGTDANATLNDSGAFFSQQDGRMHFTGDVELGPDGNLWVHKGNNQWEMV